MVNRGARSYIQQTLKAGLFGLAFFSTGLMALPQSELKVAAISLPGASSAVANLESDKSRDEELLDQLRATLRENLNTIKFIRNDGQWSEDILYKGVSRTGQVIVKSTGLKFITPQNIKGDKQAEAGFHTWSMSFKNSPGIQGIVGNDLAEVKTSYHGGLKSTSSVPSMHELLLQQVYYWKCWH